MSSTTSSQSEVRLLQASAVAIEGRGLLILGEPGAGKSTLALALIDRGATLIGDDGVALSEQSGELVAAPPPNISGKLEIRGVGIVDMPCTSAPLAVAISLDEDGERLPEAAEIMENFATQIPLIALGGSDISSRVLRAEWALRVHGRDVHGETIAEGADLREGNGS